MGLRHWLHSGAVIAALTVTAAVNAADAQVEMPVRPFHVNMDGNELMRATKHEHWLKTNAMLEITVEGADSSVLKTAVFSLKGAKLDQFSQFRLYKAKSKKSALGEIKNGKIVFSGTLPFYNEKTTYYLKATPKPRIDPDARLSVTCEKFESEAEKFDLKTTGAKSLRCAVAIVKRGDNGSESYRIPGLETTGKGTLIAVYDNRYNHSGDLPADIDVGMSRSTDGGKTWEPMRIIMDFGDEINKDARGNGIGDPLVVYDPNTKRTWVAALANRFGWSNTGTGFAPETTGQFVLTYSDDDGKTWAKPYSITEGLKDSEWHIFFNGPGKAIVLRDGTIVMPAQYQAKRRTPFSTIVYSKDKGKTWQVAKGPQGNTTEAQCVELEDGSVMLNCRNDRHKGRVIYTTKDFGANWELHPTSATPQKNGDLREPVCQASLIRARWNKGSKPGVLLFSNPNRADRNRTDMTIKASFDDGKTWPAEHQVLIDDVYGAYSCMSMVDDQTVGIFYESTEFIMTFMRIPLKEIIGNR